MFKPLRSANVATRNVLLKVTVPKRVKVRRKKGAQTSSRDDLTHKNGLHHEEQRGLAARSTQSLLRAMRDNPSQYQVQPVGSIEQTHRFRGMIFARMGPIVVISVLTHGRDARLCCVNCEYAIHEKNARANLAL